VREARARTERGGVGQGGGRHGRAAACEGRARESAEGAVRGDAQAEPTKGSRSLARRPYYGRAVSA
jgi:hypothetical protein